MVPMRSDKNCVMNKKAFQYDAYCPLVDWEGRVLSRGMVVLSRGHGAVGGVLSRGCLAVMLSGRGGGLQGEVLSITGIDIITPPCEQND